MVLGLLQIHISIPAAQSLKDKRSVIRSLKDRIVHHMNVSVAETGKQDLWKSAEITFATVAAEKGIVEQRIAKIQERVTAMPQFVLIDMETQYL